MFAYVSCISGIEYAITLMSKYGSNPSTFNYLCLKNIAQYLWATKYWGIIYHPNGVSKSLLDLSIPNIPSADEQLQEYPEDTTTGAKLIYFFVDIAHTNNSNRRRSSSMTLSLLDTSYTTWYIRYTTNQDTRAYIQMWQCLPTDSTTMSKDMGLSLVAFLHINWLQISIRTILSTLGLIILSKIVLNSVQNLAITPSTTLRSSMIRSEEPGGLSTSIRKKGPPLPFLIPNWIPSPILQPLLLQPQQEDTY